MPRDPRFVPPGSLQHVVDTTLDHRFLLRPDPRLNKILLGVLGRAQRLYAMPICAVVALSTHLHLLVRPRDAHHLADFMCRLKTDLSKEVARLRGLPKGPVFAGRFHNSTVSDEAAAQVRVLRYLLAHGVKEGLVDRVRDWPGVHCASHLMDGTPMQGLWIDRSAAHRRGRTVESAEKVQLVPLPCWEHLPDAEIRARVAELVSDIDDRAAARRRHEERPSLGIEAVLATDPLTRPSTEISSPQPRVHAVDPRVRRHMLDALRELFQAYRDASSRLRKGDRQVRFPQGTFPPAMPFVSFEGTYHVPSFCLGGSMKVLCLESPSQLGAMHFPTRGRP